MSAGIITIDPQQLNNFASGVQDLITMLQGVDPRADSRISAPPAFGQHASLPRSLHPPFAPALEYSGIMQRHITDFEDNFKTLIDKLTMLADTATAIAKNYTTAAELDSLSGNAVKALLDSAATAGNAGNG